MNLSIFSSKKIFPYSIITLLLSLLFFEFTARVQSLRPPVWFGKTNAEYLEILSRAKKDQLNGKKIIVLVGDSRVEWSLSPEIIQQELDSQFSVYNLAFPGAAVRSILNRFIENNFFPDFLIIGYSHLSVVWSNAVFMPLKEISFEEVLNSKIFSFLSENLVSFSMRKLLGKKDTEVDWIESRKISQRGQAHIVYRLKKNDAIEEQKKWYKMMYSKQITNEELKEVVFSFKNSTEVFRSHNTTIGLIRMPIGEWVLQEESKNDYLSFSQFVDEIKAPSLDLNENNERLRWQYYDDVHISPPDDVTVSVLVAKFLRSKVLTSLFDGRIKNDEINFLEGWISPGSNKSWSQKQKAKLRIFTENKKYLDIVLHTVVPRKIALFKDGKWVKTVNLSYNDFQNIKIDFDSNDINKKSFDLDFYSDEQPSHAFNGDPQSYTFFTSLILN